VASRTVSGTRGPRLVGTAQFVYGGGRWPYSAGVSVGMTFPELADYMVKSGALRHLILMEEARNVLAVW